MQKKLLVLPALLLWVSGCSVTPEKISAQDIAKTVKSDLKTFDAQQDAVTGAISLNEAIARALRSNRDKKLKDLQAALAQGQLVLARKEMLPELTAAAGYSKRNNYAASASVAFVDGQPATGSSSNYSISQPKERTIKDVEFSWNVLDFGLSYIRAKQQADRYLISQQSERVVAHNITEQVRTEYWQAVSAQRLLPAIEPLMKQAEQALNDSHYVETLQLRSPIQALYYQRELLDVLRSLQAVRQSLSDAKIRLASLMGLKPGTEFKLVDVSHQQLQVPHVKLDLDYMENYALEHRPDLLSTYYQKRISAAEVRSALVKLLPGVKFSAGFYSDNNDYLLNQDWNSIGTQISWNLFNVFKYSGQRKLAKTQELYAEQQRLATSMAVLTQVQMASISYRQSLISYRLASRYLNVADRIKVQEGNRFHSDQSSQLDYIRESLNALLAQLRRDVAYASVQTSYGRLYTSMGIDLVPEDYSGQTLEQLTALIATKLEQNLPSTQASAKATSASSKLNRKKEI